jgi:hypothetical protein
MKDLTIEGGLRRSPIAPSLRCGAHTERRNPPSNNPHQKCYPCPRPCVTHVPGQNTERHPFGSHRDWTRYKLSEGCLGEAPLPMRAIRKERPW